MKTSKIILVSKDGPEGGGASMVACQLQSLLQGTTGFQAYHWTGERHPLTPRKSFRDGAFSDFVFRSSRFISRKLGYPDFFNIIRIENHALSKNYDLYHLHDLSSVVSPFYVSAWCNFAPVLWTFHDCSPFTGGCIHPLHCDTYETGCGNCPQLTSWPMLTSVDHTSWIRKYKVSLINKKLSAVICPSKWVASEAVKSGIREDILKVIPNAVDTKIFFPKQKSDARRRLGLPINSCIAFLGSTKLSNPYKGSEYAINSLSNFGSNLNVLVVGDNHNSIVFENGPNYHFRDLTLDRSLLADYYSACDFFLLPSVAENFPLMLLESMACGTPAIAFATGGIPEAVSHMENGWLTATGDTEDMARGIQFALSHPKIREYWSENARSTIEARYSENRFLQSHIKLYEEVLDRDRYQ